MIEVTYNRRQHSVTMSGHAYSDVPGRDLVCAAASALAYTLADNVRKMYAKEMARSKTINMELGKAEISCVPVRKYQPDVEMILDAICAGFALLSASYPQYLTYALKP